METINVLQKPDKVFTIEPITRHKFTKEISEYLLLKSLKPGKATICAAGLVLYNIDFFEMPYNQMFSFITLVRKSMDCILKQNQ